MDKNKIKETLKAKLKQEMSTTGTGASVTPGTGEGVATKYAFGKRTNKGTPKDWKAAPSIPNRPSKAMDYKELWEDFKVGDKVTYLGHPAEITAVNKEMTGDITYNVLYDKGTGKTKVSNIYNKGGEIKPLKENTGTTYFDELQATGNLTKGQYPDEKTKLPVYTLRDRPEGKQYVRFAYDATNDKYGIKQVGGYRLETSTLQKAGMRPTQTWTAGIESFITDGNYNPVFINIDLFKQIVDETMGGFSKYAKAFGDFYKDRGTTSGTIDENTDDLEAIKAKVIAWSKTLPKGTFDSWGDFEDNVRQATTKSQIRDAMIDANYSQDLDVTDKFDELGLGYDESEKSTDPLMKKSTTNSEELARVQGLLQRANDEKSYSVMSAYEYKIKMLRILVALEKKYNTTLPLLQFHKTVLEYLREHFPGFTGKFGPYNQKWSLIAAHLEKALSEKQGMNENVNENLDIDDRVKVVYGNQFYGETGTITDIKRGFITVEMDSDGNEYSMHSSDVEKIEDDIEDEIDDVNNKVNNADDYLNSLDEGIYIPDNIMRFAKRKGVESVVKKIAGWVGKADKRIMGGTAIGKDYSTLILDLTYQGGEIRINTDDETIEVNGEDVYDFDSFMDAVDTKPINENYARFRNETKTRTKPEQFHNAVKEVKKKVQEINRLFEYMDRLQSELKESEGGLKTKKYTENALYQIKEATKALFLKSTKLK